MTFTPSPASLCYEAPRSVSHQPGIPSAAREEGTSTICWKELPPHKWKCCHILPGHRPPWHTLPSGRSLGPGHTRRTHRPSLSTFHPGTAGSHRPSSFWQETHILHSSAREAGLCFDPGETENSEGRDSPSGTMESSGGRERHRTLALCNTAPASPGEAFSTSALLSGGRPFISLYNIPHSLRLLILSKDTVH